MRTKTDLYNHPQLTYQTWQTNSRYKYQPPLPLGRCEFDSWCSLAPAVGMRKHGMGAEGRQSENCFAGLLLCREGGDLPVHSTKPVDGGAARRLVVSRPRWPLVPAIALGPAPALCGQTNATSVMGALGFKEAPILTYLMRRNRYRDSPRSRSSTNKVLRARSDLLVVLGDDVVLVGDQPRRCS